MKKIFIGLLIFIVAVSIYAASTSTMVKSIKTVEKNYSIQQVTLLTNQLDWETLDTTTMAGNEPNDLGATERTYAQVIADSNTGAAEITVVTIPSTWNGVKFRCMGATDTNTVTYQVYVGTLMDYDTDCDLAFAGQLAWTIGGQTSLTSGYYYAESVTVTTTTSSCTASWSSASPANDKIAQARIDLEGENLLVLIPTTVNCNCKLLGKGF